MQSGDNLLQKVLKAGTKSLYRKHPLFLLLSNQPLWALPILSVASFSPPATGFLTLFQKTCTVTPPNCTHWAFNLRNKYFIISKSKNPEKELYLPSLITGMTQDLHVEIREMSGNWVTYPTWGRRVRFYDWSPFNNHIIVHSCPK